MAQPDVTPSGAGASTCSTRALFLFDVHRTHAQPAPQLTSDPEIGATARFAGELEESGATSDISLAGESMPEDVSREQVFDRVACVSFAYLVAGGMGARVPIDASDVVNALKSSTTFLTQCVHRVGHFNFRLTSFKRARKFFEWLARQGIIELTYEANAVFIVEADAGHPWIGKTLNESAADVLQLNQHTSCWSDCSSE